MKLYLKSAFLLIFVFFCYFPKTTYSAMNCAEATVVDCATCVNGQKACTYHCTRCADSTEGIACPDGAANIPEWSGMVNCDSGGGAVCICKADNICDSSCPVYQSANRLAGVTYATSFSCTRTNGPGGTNPTQEQKNSFCTRTLRTKGDADGTGGDADGTGGVDEFIDFSLYIGAVVGGQINPAINPDFNGDGLISPEDLDIWRVGKGSGVPPTATTAPAAPTNTPTPTVTVVPGQPTNTPTPTVTTAPGSPTPSSVVSLHDKGDANNDGLINDADFAIWQSAYGTKYDNTSPNLKLHRPDINADFNNDYWVNLTDFEIWRKNAIGI